MAGSFYTYALDGLLHFESFDTLSKCIEHCKCMCKKCRIRYGNQNRITFYCIAGFITAPIKFPS